MCRVSWVKSGFTLRHSFVSLSGDFGDRNIPNPGGDGHLVCTAVAAGVADREASPEIARGSDVDRNAEAGGRVVAGGLTASRDDLRPVDRDASRTRHVAVGDREPARVARLADTERDGRHHADLARTVSDRERIGRPEHGRGIDRYGIAVGVAQREAYPYVPGLGLRIAHLERRIAHDPPSCPLRKVAPAEEGAARTLDELVAQVECGVGIVRAEGQKLECGRLRAVVLRSEALGEQQRGHRDAAVVVADSPDGHLHAVVAVASQVEVVRRVASQKNVIVQRNAHKARMDMDERRSLGGMDPVPQPGLGDGRVRAAQVLGQVVRAGGHAVVRNLLLVEARKQRFRGRPVVGEGREGGRNAAQRNGVQFEARRALLPERNAQIEPCEASLQP